MPMDTNIIECFGSIVLMSKIELCSGCSWIKHLGTREALFMQNFTLFTMVVREERRGKLRRRCYVSLTWWVRFLDQQCGAEHRETSGGYLFLLFLLESRWQICSSSEVGPFTAALPRGHWTPMLTHCVHTQTFIYWIVNTKCKMPQRHMTVAHGWFHCLISERC